MFNLNGQSPVKDKALYNKRTKPSQGQSPLNQGQSPLCLI